MTAGDILKFILDHPGFTLIGTMTIIQISPIKINPWGWILKNVRTLFIGDLETRISKRLDDVDKRIAEMTDDIVSEQIANLRWNILDFANSCMQNRQHSKEQWNHCLNELKKYEDYCKRKSIPNGTMEEAAKYLRTVYQERLKKNDFLV